MLYMLPCCYADATSAGFAAARRAYAMPFTTKMLRYSGHYVDIAYIYTPYAFSDFKKYAIISLDAVDAAITPPRHAAASARDGCRAICYALRWQRCWRYVLVVLMPAMPYDFRFTPLIIYARVYALTQLLRGASR